MPEAWCLRSAFHDRLTKEPNGHGFSGWLRMRHGSKLSASGLEGTPRQLMAGVGAQLSPTGHLLFLESPSGSARATRLLAARLDPSTLTLGAAVPVVEDMPGFGFFQLW